MIFDIRKHTDVCITPRVQQVMDDFDIKQEHSNEWFHGDIDIENQDWHIGLIVGSSGSGKSTIAKHLFRDSYINSYEYDDRSVIDNMPDRCMVSDIEKAYTSVGFSSPPCWLKPYKVLSTGEKMRVDLARAILEDKEIIAFDEFTSVVDREVAKTCSQAISKVIRSKNKKFVAVSCHSDIIEYLQPDWIYDTDQKSFFGTRENMSSPIGQSAYIKLSDMISNRYGKYLGTITI